MHTCASFLQKTFFFGNTGNEIRCRKLWKKFSISQKYVKNDAELASLLLKMALQNVEFYTGENAPVISATALENLANETQQVSQSMQRLSRYYPEQLQFIP